MAFIKIDLPGLAQYHRGYHVSRGTICNHDCQFYEEIGENVLKYQREMIQRVIEEWVKISHERLNPGDELTEIHIPDFMIELICERVFGNVE